MVIIEVLRAKGKYLISSLGLASVVIFEAYLAKQKINFIIVVILMPTTRCLVGAQA